MRHRERDWEKQNADKLRDLNAEWTIKLHEASAKTALALRNCEQERNLRLSQHVASVSADKRHESAWETAKLERLALDQQMITAAQVSASAQRQHELEVCLKQQEEEKKAALKQEEERQTALKLEEEWQAALKREEERQTALKQEEERQTALKREEERQTALKQEEERQTALKREEKRQTALKREEERQTALKREEDQRALEQTKSDLEALNCAATTGTRLGLVTRNPDPSAHATADAQWDAAFDAHIACSLEESGYPRRVAWSEQCSTYVQLPAPKRVNGAPTLPALSELQAKAREFITAHFAAIAKTLDKNTKANVVMHAMFHNAAVGCIDHYHLVVRLNDVKFPANAAHFRAAAVGNTLGSLLHNCFVPHGETAASLPFVTLFHPEPETACATSSLTLPATDIVYGEYSAPAAWATHPVGTVLMYPRSVVPSEPSNNKGSCDTPVFIVFKSCKASLLRGAVPVGRVMSCVPGYVAAARDNGTVPFDTTVLRCFERHNSLKTCETSNCSTYSSVKFCEFPAN